MVIGFVLSKYFAFNAKGSGNTRREMVKFLIISLIALVVTYVVSVSMLYILTYKLSYAVEVVHETLVRIIGPTLTLPTVRDSLAHITGMGFSFITNFIGHKLFTFKSTGVYDRVSVRMRQGKS